MYVPVKNLRRKLCVSKYWATVFLVCLTMWSLYDRISYGAAARLWHCVYLIVFSFSLSAWWCEKYYISHGRFLIFIFPVFSLTLQQQKSIHVKRHSPQLLRMRPRFRCPFPINPSIMLSHSSVFLAFVRKPQLLLFVLISHANFGADSNQLHRKLHIKVFVLNLCVCFYVYCVLVNRNWKIFRKLKLDRSDKFKFVMTNYLSLVVCVCVLMCDK